MLLLVFPDSPSSLINRDRDEDAARRALEKLRQSKDVSGEIDAIKAESRESKSDRSLTISELFTTRELKWPLITSIVLQLTQQLCGINAVSKWESQTIAKIFSKNYLFYVHQRYSSIPNQYSNQRTSKTITFNTLYSPLVELTFLQQ